MKKVFGFVSILLAVLCLCACGDSPASVQPSADYDVDLTALSSTMVYSEVYNMVTEPDGYLGKSVKMNGSFSIYHDESTGKYYFACLIADATACCSQGIEFVLEGEHSYPEDYPELGSEITVTGIFDQYEEAGYTYFQLIHASLL